jgi:hypothetical protein
MARFGGPNSVTVPRYVAVVAAIYMVVFVGGLALIGELDVAAPRFWVVPVGAILLAVLGTVVPIARFGNAGGSIYFAPTVLHVCVVALTIVAGWRVAAP